MPRSDRASGRLLGWGLPGALAIMLVWHFGAAPFGAAPGWAAPEPALPSGGTLRLLVSHAFYGSTPTLAWSPDGTRLAFNAAYEYYGYETDLATHRADLGLWVYERDTSAARQLGTEQRFHPAWLGDAEIASSCSPYETCTEGLYVTDIAGAERRIEVDGVYHTAAASSTAHEVVFFNGFPGYTTWNRMDVSTLSRASYLSANCSWEPPPELVADQCVQQVGDVGVAVDASTGLWVRYGEGAPVQIDSTPPYVYSSAAWDCPTDHSGPVAPCLSADGRQVAYVGQGPTSLLLRVIELPTSTEVALVPLPPSPVAAPPGLFAAPGMPLAVAPSAVVTPEPVPMVSAVTPTVSGEVTRTFLAFDLYGDTASLAWSPDGRRLAFNAAFQGSAYRAEWDPFYTSIVTQLGLFVADVDTSTVQRVTTDQRYHPTWTDDQTIASSCSSSEACTAGVVLTDLTGASRTAVAGEIVNTAAASDGRVLFYDVMAALWNRYDPGSGSVEAGVSATCLYEPPIERVQDQCIQAVGDVRVWVQSGLGLFAQVGTAPAIRLDPTPPWLFEGGFAYGCSHDDFSGPPQACLSPDGQHVAYVARGVMGPQLHLHIVPR